MAPLRRYYGSIKALLRRYYGSIKALLHLFAPLLQREVLQASGGGGVHYQAGRRRYVS